jgi:hypothetical protein
MWQIVETTIAEICSGDIEKAANAPVARTG